MLTHIGLYRLAIAFWLFAGFNVLNIVRTIAFVPSLWSLGWFAVAFAFFSGFVFPRVARKGIEAIQTSGEARLPFYRCFRPSSWLIMPLMMGMGFGLRISGWVSDEFILGFYWGLGLSLVLTTRFYIAPIRAVRSAAKPD